MENSLDFLLQPNGAISTLFLERNIDTFAKACVYVRQLRYGRNTNKNDLTTLFTEQCGTCGTKNALLKRVAEENGVGEVCLFIGIFRMNAQNSPKVGKVLQQYNLAYLPEAHNYLKIGNTILDCTWPAEKTLRFEDVLMQEIEISVAQITAFKVQYHQEFLTHWLVEQSHLAYTPEELWHIREACITALSL